MAHQGLEVDEIAAQVDLSRGEIEFIAKVNREQLMFCEDSLPEWANTDEDLSPGANQDFSDVDNISFMKPLQRENTSDISSIFEVPRTDNDAMKKLGDAFKAAVQEGKEKDETPQAPTIFNVTQDIAQNFLGEKPQTAVPLSLIHI